jgi:DNA-directed RNA polymerase sigma subunit (sigma70/sigma32)
MSKADSGAVQYYKDVAHHSINITEEEEIKLFKEREIIKNDPTQVKRLKEIDGRLVLSVIKMASELALRYAAKIPGIDVKDAIQEANEAMIDSLRLYNPNLRTASGERVKFNTYAHYRAEYRIKEYIMNNSRLVRLPRTRLDDLFELMAAVEQLKPSDTIEDLRNLLNARSHVECTIEEVYKSLELLQGVHTSLDQTVRNDSVGRNQSLKDIIPVPEEVLNQEQELDKKMATKVLGKRTAEVLKPYKDLTYEVIYYRFLDPEINKMRTHKETAVVMEKNGHTTKVLSRERVRQLEVIALGRLERRAPEIKDLL